MQILDDGRCFVCGKDNPIGLKAVFTRDAELRRAETKVLIPELFQGWQGITHGGIISALLDEICAQACMVSGMTVVTGEMKLRYHALIPTESVVTVTGQMDGKLMAEADVVMYRT